MFILVLRAVKVKNFMNKQYSQMRWIAAAGHLPLAADAGNI